MSKQQEIRQYGRTIADGDAEYVRTMEQNNFADETNERLMNGYDYDRQAWVVDGRYVRCGHPDSMQCKCYGRIHAGESIQMAKCADCQSPAVTRTSAGVNLCREQPRTSTQV